jgi:hypothetical protein
LSELLKNDFVILFGNAHEYIWDPSIVHTTETRTNANTARNIRETIDRQSTVVERRACIAIAMHALRSNDCSSFCYNRNSRLVAQFFRIVRPALPEKKQVERKNGNRRIRVMKSGNRSAGENADVVVREV